MNMTAKKRSTKVQPSLQEYSSKVKSLEEYKNHLEFTNFQQTQIIDTFVNTTQMLLEEKIEMAENFINGQQNTIGLLLAKTRFIYRFLKEKGFEISDIFEYVNDLKIKHKDDKKKIANINKLERLLHMDLMIKNEENEEPEEKSEDNSSIDDI